VSENDRPVSTQQTPCGDLSSHFWGGVPCDDDPRGMNCLLCRSIFPLGVMAAFCSGVSLSVSTKPTAVKLFTQASTCRLASVGPTPRSSAKHSTISPVAGWIKRTFGVAHALRNRARMRTKRGMFSHPQSLPRLDGKGSGPAVGVAGPFGCATLDPVLITQSLKFLETERKEHLG
jgi:hypothetical protein